VLKRAENLVLAAALASMALLPVAEILLRALLRVASRVRLPSPSTSR